MALKVEVDKIPYRIRWHHEFLLNGRVVKARTVCWISDTDKVDISQADSFCSRKDAFDPEIGRKVSLSRTLDKLNFTKEQRKQVWTQYFNRTQDPRKNHANTHMTQ